MQGLALAPPSLQPALACPAFQTWRDPAGCVSAEFYRLETGLLARFPQVADFQIDDTGDCITCCPCPGVGMAWRGIWEQQIQPLLLSLRGEQVFHGGAIAVGGEAIAFLGPSGRGKSTLTTAFARRGHAFLSDDCLHLAMSGLRVLVHPHASHVRLREDSAAALGEGEAAYVAGSQKPRLSAGERLPYCDRALPLSRLYLLGEADVHTPAIATLSPSQALIGLTANAFVLDIKNPEVLKRNLKAGARLVGEVPMRRLDYPRRYDVLPAVVEAVLADVAG